MEVRYFGQCKQCGQEVGSYYKSQLPTFCSHKCSNKWKWDNIRKRKKINEYACARCGKKVLVYEKDHRIKEGQSVFYCSAKCRADAYSELKQKTCPICNKKHNKKSQSCCRECGTKLATWKWHEKNIGIIFPNYFAYKAYVEKIIKEKECARLSGKRMFTEDEKKKRKRNTEEKGEARKDIKSI